MTEHKHANILRAIADGKEIEYRYVRDGKWWPSDFEEFCRVAEDPSYQFRVKPARISGWINVFPNTVWFYDTKEQADASAKEDEYYNDQHRIACIPVEFDEGEGL